MSVHSGLAFYFGILYVDHVRPVCPRRNYLHIIMSLVYRKGRLSDPDSLVELTFFILFGITIGYDIADSRVSRLTADKGELFSVIKGTVNSIHWHNNRYATTIV